MKEKRPNALDFETEAIQPFPAFPPTPVGLSAELPGQPPIYLAWGHPTENNCTKQDAKDLLVQSWERAKDEPMLFHNGCAFDIPVAMENFGLPYPPHDQWEDTLFSLFLLHPLASTLSLKPSAARLLNMPPTEQDAVRDWLVTHGFAHAAAKDWGAHIAKAPGGLVGTYARGDTTRTLGLHRLLHSQVAEQGMSAAYDREKQLAPILYANSKRGIRLDRARLIKDAAYWEGILAKADAEIKSVIGECNIDSGRELAAAIQASGVGVPTEQWPKTPTRQLSTAREVLLEVVTHTRTAQLLAYRGAVSTCLETFMRKWIVMSETDGRLHTSWNQVRNDKGGARTGRLSSDNPPFMNVPTDFAKVPIPEGFPPLPRLRVYFLPEEGEVFVSADFHSQEVRILGHFAEGAIQQIYKDNPSADIHQVAADMIKDTTGYSMDRKATKIIAFSILYGAGPGKVAHSLGVDFGTAVAFKNAYYKTLQGVQEFQRDVEARARAKQSVRSWGGRVLYAPEGVVTANGGFWNKDYVLVNYLIQGSAADQTKQAIIDYDKTSQHGTFLVTVHDEICISCPKSKLKSEIKLLRAAMEAGDWDLPMRATVKVGPNWEELQTWK